MVATADVGAKGRLVIPARIRAEAGIESGQTVIVSADGVGRIVLETPEAVQARVWAAAPGSDADAVADVRALHERDNRLAQAAADERRQPRDGVPDDGVPDDGVPDDGAVDPVGAALLAALGL